MPPLLETSWMSLDWWVLIALPVLAAGAGGLSGWLSLRMLFGPLPIGEENAAIVQRRHASMLDRLAATVGTRVSLVELFRLMQPEKIAAQVSDMVAPKLEEHVDDVMTERYAVLWANLPYVVRQRIYERAGRQLPAIFDNLVEDMAEHVDELVDIRQLMGGLAGEARTSLAALLTDWLVEERRFLLRGAAWVGAVLGTLQGLLVAYHPALWLVMVTSVAIAVAALVMPRALLFPSGPDVTRLSRFMRYDLERLQQVLARRLAREYFSLHRIMQMMMRGPREARARSMVRRHLRPLLESGLVRTSSQVLLGVQGYAYVKQAVAERIAAVTVSVLADSDAGRAADEKVERVCLARLETLEPVALGELVQSVLDEGLWMRVVMACTVGTLAGALAFLLVAQAGV